MTTASPAEASTKAIGVRNRTATKIFNTINAHIMRINHFMVFTVLFIILYETVVSAVSKKKPP